MKAIYYDMVEVKDEIRSFVNIERYGDLHYKKMNLHDYSRKLLSDNGIKAFYRITTKNDIRHTIERIRHSDNEDFLFFSSNLTVINRESFSLFLKKIKHINSSLALCGPDCVKPFLKISSREVISMLQAILNEDQDFYKVLEQKSLEVEKFSQENFYHEIKNYNDFVAYLQTNFELRYFNSIQSTRKVLTKRSVQKEKMLKEYTFYSVLPDTMKIYFLPPFGYEEQGDHAQYSMERLNVLDVSTQWIHHSLREEEFSRLLYCLFEFIASRKRRAIAKEDAPGINEELYIGKLESRLRVFKETPLYKKLDSIVSNSTGYGSIEEIVLRYKQLTGSILKKYSLNNQAVISHGDLCFSNMLYDKRIDFIKLIDPKGCLCEQEAYMDSYYDIAKLSHSVLGNYDFINNGIFEIRYDNAMGVHLDIPGLEKLSDQKEVFIKFLKEHGFPYDVVRIREASLFLSMLPLHIDYPKKVLAFILTAINILNELGQKYTKKS